MVRYIDEKTLQSTVFETEGEYDNCKERRIVIVKKKIIIVQV